jgi:hypothetical protein
MSLPTVWTKPPIDAKPSEIYIYRPDFYQDQDGIERRIGLWLDPSTRTSMKMRLSDVLATPPPKVPPAAAAAGAPVPAVPAAGDHEFRSEFEDAYHGGSATRKVSATTNAPSGQAVPSGRSSDTP